MSLSTYRSRLSKTTYTPATFLRFFSVKMNSTSFNSEGKRSGLDLSCSTRPPLPSSTQLILPDGFESRLPARRLAGKRRVPYYNRDGRLSIASLNMLSRASLLLSVLLRLDVLIPPFIAGLG